VGQLLYKSCIYHQAVDFLTQSADVLNNIGADDRLTVVGQVSLANARFAIDKNEGIRALEATVIKLERLPDTDDDFTFKAK
jgi:hypothetical protein